MRGPCSGITVSDADLSWTSSSTHTGYGIYIEGGSTVSDLTVTGVTANNRVEGLSAYPYSSTTTDVDINNSVFNGDYDIRMYGSSNVQISNTVCSGSN